MKKLSEAMKQFIVNLGSGKVLSTSWRGQPSYFFSNHHITANANTLFALVDRGIVKLQVNKFTGDTDYFLTQAGLAEILTRKVTISDDPAQ